MKKHVRILSLIVALAMLFALVACDPTNPDNPDNPDNPVIGGDDHVCKHICLLCGKCTDSECTNNVCSQKCQGHEQAHVCQHICGQCDKCTDATCTNEACAQKCQGHEQAHVCQHICGQCDKCTDATCTNEACAQKCQCESGNIHNNPVVGAVVLTKVQGDLEAAYVTWEIDSNAKWYNVYCKASDATEYGNKIDEPLVRKYGTYFRADVVGLKAGRYDMKVVPVNADGTEATEYASEATGINVLAHERYGFAFVNGTSSGAYNDDGTLKSNARVIYITEKTKNTVSLEVTGVKTNPCVGLQSILDGYKKGKDSRPLAVRLVGNITDFDYMLNGDIVIENKKMSDVGITFEGIGSDATANGWGIRVKNASNIEIRNLGFMNTDSGEGDDIGLQQGNDHIWVHNCDLFYGQQGSDSDQAKGDGALDTKDSSYVTHSYNHFWDCGKCNLQGMKSETTENYITYHHNWYDHSDSRHPRVRTCTVHVFNNYYDGNAKYCVGATMGSSIFVENNYFRSTAILHPMLSSNQGTDALGDGTFSGEDGGIIKSYGNKYDVAKASDLRLITYQTNNTSFDCYEASSRNEQVPSSVVTLCGRTTYNNFDTSPDMYTYVVDTPEVAKAKVQQFAGRVDGGDFKFTFDDQKDDADYEVNSELKNKLLNYKTTVEEIGELPASSTGGAGEGGEVNPPVGPIEGAIVSSFEGGNASNSSITVSGNAKNATFEVKAIGQTFSSGLKIETSTSVKFTTTEKMILTLYVDGSAGKAIKVDGVDCDVVATDLGDKVVVVTLEAGEHTITKKDSFNLWYLTLVPVEAE